MEIIKKYLEYLITEKEVKHGDTEKGQIPKNELIMALAKDLYKAQFDAVTFKYKLKNKIKKMKANGASEDDIEDAKEMGEDQMANTQLRADSIEAQMLAIGAGDKTGNMAVKAQELASEAINIALKDAQKYFEEKAKSMLYQSSKNKKSDKKDSDKKDSDKKED